jgi:hypothetical protein
MRLRFTSLQALAQTFCKTKKYRERCCWVRLVACIWRTMLPGCRLALFGCLDLLLGLAALVQDSPPGLALEKRQNRPFFLGRARSVRRLVR